MFDLFTYSEDSPLLFTQAMFWIFFGALVLSYQFIASKIAVRNFFLLIFSFFFYYLSSGYYFVLLIVSTLIDYQLGNKIYRTKNKEKKKKYVTISVIANLSMLAYFKYTYFFTDSFNTVFETDLEVFNLLAAMLNGIFGTTMDVGKIFLPVGISFYTFQTISYSVDIYRGHLKPVKNILDFAFYVSFFPQLVAGPIVRAAHFVPQIYERFVLSKEEFGRALFLILNGLVKKVLISDYISINYVDRVFESPLEYSGFENLMAVYGYSIQIYCDFSGYTDIAIGVALLLGFRLPLNFNSPYKAVNITDFWRRWHISLSSWLRDYLYISMGGNRKGKIKTYLFLLITMLLGGLWHGAHIRFIIWGALHGAALALHKVWLGIIKGGKDGTEGSWASNLIGGAITFHFVAFCWIFFRADTIDVVQNILLQITENFNPSSVSEVVWAYKYVFLIMLMGYVIHWLPSDWKFNLSEQFTSMPDFAKAFIIIGVSLMLFQITTSDIQPFIYFQF